MTMGIAGIKHSIIGITGTADLPGGFHLRKEVRSMNTYEEFMIIINAASLIITILIYVKDKNSTKK